MSGIVLSAATRQSLLAAQDTANLLATTQSRLATGKKVNSALDNPTSFFTAAGLDSRANDLSNLLDGINNGVQALQAASTGLSSIQKLVDTAKSVANQALQTAVGYSTKSTITAATLTGATATNLLGDKISASVDGTAVTTAKTRTAYTNAAATAGTALKTGTSNAAATGATLINALTSGSSATPTGPVAGDSFTVGGKLVTFAATGAATADAGGNYTIGIDQSLNSLMTVIDTLQGTSGSTAASVNGSGQIALNTGTTQNLVLVDTTAGTLAKLGLSAGTTNRGGGTETTNGTLAGTSKLNGTTPGGGTALATGFAANDTLTINGKTLTFVASGATGANQINVTDDVSTLLTKIDGLTGASGSSITAGKITLNTGAASDLAITSSNTAAFGALGLPTAGVSQARSTPLAGLTLTIGATGGGVATDITFGTGSGQVSTLADLNAKLAANNLQATISTAGAISITTTNEAASATIGTVGGTSTASGKAFNGLTSPAAVADTSSQATRQNLISQYNNILSQIRTTAQDASFNGVNLLNGDNLKLVFNETGKSTLTITGVRFDPDGLGLSSLGQGGANEFKDTSSINSVISTLSSASTTLRAQASTFGSNLSVVQNRQDFSKQLINVLQTGSANLVNADLNEEAANSQALATRQSLAISALSLANSAQQNVLQLLR